jgi:hypothetical protein
MRRIGEGPRPDFTLPGMLPDPRLATVLDRGLRHVPAERFQSVSEMRLALAPFLDPNVGYARGVALLLRHLFHDEFEASRIPGALISG